MKEYHIYTSKRYVLSTIKTKYEELGDWSYLNILVKNKEEIKFVDSYNELVELLKDVDKVYDFYEVETKRHGEVGYDIIVNE